MKKHIAILSLIISIFTFSIAFKAHGSHKTNSEALMAHRPVVLVDTAALAEMQPTPDDDQLVIDQLNEIASSLLGRKYVWGATGPKNFDCSGFTSYIFRKAGIELPRTSVMQWTRGEKIDKTDLRAGDLVFFSSPRSGKGRVGHVGMVVEVHDDKGSITFVHAATKKGISYQKLPDGGYYSRNYIGARRVIA